MCNGLCLHSKYDRHSLHCILLSVSNNSKQVYVAHVLNHFLERRTTMGCRLYFVVETLKRLSVRVVLDLLHEFPNTMVISLSHNRMWQSGYSEIDVNLVYQ